MAHDSRAERTPGARVAGVWRRYLQFWGPRAAADVDDELRFHIEMRVRDAMARGMSEADARDATLRRLGDLAAARTACVAITTRRHRRLTRALFLDALIHDLRFAFRTLGRQRGWTAVAVVTLALGIGASTAVFSVVNSLILHPIAYPRLDRLAILFQEPTAGNGTGMRITVTPGPAVVRAWREQAHTLEALEPYATTDRTLERAGEPAGVVSTALILPSFIRFAGSSMLAGRNFSDDEITGRARVALVSEGFWRSRFGADPATVGAHVTLDGEIYTIVGVTPSSLALPRLQTSSPDFWTPLDMKQENIGIYSVVRLRAGATAATAAAELDSIAARLPAEVASRGKFRAKLVPPGEMLSFRQSLLMLSGAVILVLLIACANVAHLLLARAAVRQRELAIRAALGAGRGRLVRQLLTESAVLASAGCIGGIALGWLGTTALVALRPIELGELAVARMDGAALAAAVALSATTGLLFGVVGALQARRESTHDALKAGALTTSHGGRQHRLRSLLVVTEMALSTTLLIGATLLVRSVLHLQQTNPGFDPVGLYSLKVSLPARLYASDTAKAQFHAALANRVRAIPGVRAATIADGAPPSRSFLLAALQFEGDPMPPVGVTSFIDYNGVEPDYFRVLGIPLLRGRTFTDTTSANHEVIVSQATARRHFPQRDAVGRKLRTLYNGEGEWRTIVGVVADAATGGLTQPSDAPVIYLPSGLRIFSPSLIVRAEPGADPIAAIRRAVTELDAHVPAPTVLSVDNAMRESIASPRFTMQILGAFAFLALVLAAVGLYGVLAYAVAQRTREIGIRLALGATRRRVARAVLREGVGLAAIGIVIGLIGAYWGSQAIERMLYGVPRGDPLSFVAAALALVVTAVVACVVPLRRAMAVDPLIAMRAD